MRILFVFGRILEKIAEDWRQPYVSLPCCEMDCNYVELQNI
jgi:hypothetical protein